MDVDQLLNFNPGSEVVDYYLDRFLPPNPKYIGLGISNFSARLHVSLKVLSYTRYSFKLEIRSEGLGGWWAKNQFYVLLSNWGIIL